MGANTFRARWMTLWLMKITRLSPRLRICWRRISQKPPWALKTGRPRAGADGMRRPFSAGAWVKRLLLRIVLVMAVFWGGGLAVFSIMPVPFSAVMVERQLGAWLSGDFGYVAHSDWVSMDEISPFMGLAVIAAEDQKFPEHWGSTLRPLRRRWPITNAMKTACAARQRCRSRRPKICFCGTAAAGCERGWKRGSPRAWKRSGAKAHSDRVSQRCRVWRRGIWCRSCITTLF